MTTLAIIISALSFFISALTTWLMLFNKGKLKMTHPNVLAFAFDGPDGPPKVFMRSLLFTTSKRGHVVEGMYLTFRQTKNSYCFSDWAYGDAQLVFGSGLHVPYEGFVSNYHFLLPREKQNFKFVEGHQALEVYARVTHKKSSVLLFKTHFFLEQSEAIILADRRNVIFTWDPTKQTYKVSQIEPRTFVFAV